MMAAQHTPIPVNRSIWKSPWPGVFLFLCDAVGFTLAWYGAWYLRRLLNPAFDLPINELDPYLAVFPAVLFVGLVNASVFGMYRVRRRLSSLTSWDRLIRVGYHYLLYMMVIGYFMKELELGRSVIFFAGALAFIYLLVSRSIFRGIKSRAFRKGRGLVRAAIVGTGPLARDVRERLDQHPEIGFELAGYIRHPSDPPDTPAAMRMIGTADDIELLIERHAIEDLFVAVAHLEPNEQLNLINLSQRPGLQINLVSNLFGVITARAKVDEIAAFPVIPLRHGQLSRPAAFAKRLFDIVVAGTGMIVWLLFFHWWISLWIRSDTKGPVFFTQERVGRNGKPFRIYKYRTMVPETKVYDHAPVDSTDPRVTRAGRFLRKTSIDEVPQLINVLRGEMSMVGPRPEMQFIVDQYEEWQKRRLDVKPGITGLWQVIGRKNLPLHLNMEYDFYYIMNQSLLLDIEILIRTVPAVLKGKGAF